MLCLMSQRENSKGAREIEKETKRENRERERGEEKGERERERSGDGLYSMRRSKICWPMISMGFPYHSERAQLMRSTCPVQCRACFKLTWRDYAAGHVAWTGLGSGRHYRVGKSLNWHRHSHKTRHNIRPSCATKRAYSWTGQEGSIHRRVGLVAIDGWLPDALWKAASMRPDEIDFIKL